MSDCLVIKVCLRRRRALGGNSPHRTNLRAPEKKDRAGMQPNISAAPNYVFIIALFCHLLDNLTSEWPSELEEVKTGERMSVFG